MNQKANILLVDTDVFWQDTLKELLTSRGHYVEVARLYTEAKNLLERSMFDVAVVDIPLDGTDQSNIDGMKIATRFRGTSTNVVVVSGSMSYKLVREALLAGAVDVMNKNEINKLVEAVEYIISKKTLIGIFISYARADFDKVISIYETLLSENYHAWMDTYSIKGGEDWLRTIYKAIDESEMFLAVLSNNSVSQRGVIQKELKKALDKWNGMLPDDVYLIPIRIDDCPIPDLVKHIQVLDWDNGKGENKLLEAIRVGLARRKAYD